MVFVFRGARDFANGAKKFAPLVRCAFPGAVGELGSPSSQSSLFTERTQYGDAKAIYVRGRVRRTKPARVPQHPSRPAVVKFDGPDISRIGVRALDHPIFASRLFTIAA